MVAIERPHRTNRQPDAMHRQRIAFAQRAELRVRRPAGAHVVLGVNLEESDRLRSGEDVVKMRGLEADAGTRGQIRDDGHSYIPAVRRPKKEEARAGRRAPLLAQDLIGSSEPVPFGVLIVAHVPFATYFQALPW